MAGVYIFILLFQFILATAWFCSTKMKFSMKDFFIFCAAFVSYVNCWIYIFALSLSYNLSMYIFIHDFPVTVFVASLSGIAGFLGFESSFLVYAVYVLFFLLQDSFEQNDICFHKSHGVLCVLGIVLEELIWFWLIFFVFLMCLDGFCIYFHFLSSNCFFQKRCQFHFYVFGSCFP